MDAGWWVNGADVLKEGYGQICISKHGHRILSPNLFFLTSLSLGSPTASCAQVDLLSHMCSSSRHHPCPGSSHMLPCLDRCPRPLTALCLWLSRPFLHTGCRLRSSEHLSLPRLRVMEGKLSHGPGLHAFSLPPAARRGGGLQFSPNSSPGPGLCILSWNTCPLILPSRPRADAASSGRVPHQPQPHPRAFFF